MQRFDFGFLSGGPKSKAKKSPADGTLALPPCLDFTLFFLQIAGTGGTEIFLDGFSEEIEVDIILCVMGVKGKGACILD